VMTTDHDNVHRLHDDVHETDAGIVHETAERIDTSEVHEDGHGTVHDGVVIDAEVVEGEILTEEESATLDERLANRGVLVRRAVSTGQVAKRVAVQVGTHDRTKQGGKAAARYAYTVV